MVLSGRSWFITMAGYNHISQLMWYHSYKFITDTKIPSITYGINWYHIYSHKYGSSCIAIVLNQQTNRGHQLNHRQWRRASKIWSSRPIPPQFKARSASEQWTPTGYIYLGLMDWVPYEVRCPGHKNTLSLSVYDLIYWCFHGVFMAFNRLSWLITSPN